MIEDSSLGFNVLQHRNLEKSFENILDACVELDGARDPKRVIELLMQAGAVGKDMLGTDGDLGEMVEMFESEEGKKMFALATQGGVAKLRMVVWGVVDSVIRLIEEDPAFVKRMQQHQQGPVTREEIQAHFETTVSAWLEQDRPELMFAARTYQARRRLNEIQMGAFKTRDWWGVAMLLLDPHP